MTDSLPLPNDNIDTSHPDAPVTSDKHPLVWGGNRAHIAGNLDAVDRFYVRTGSFQPLLQNRAMKHVQRRQLTEA